MSGGNISAENKSLKISENLAQLRFLTFRGCIIIFVFVYF